MKFEVTLWSGAGYWRNEPVTVEARDEEEALVLASIADPHAFYVDDADVVEERDEMEKADNYVYLDRSEYGHSNIWLCIENALIRALD